MKGEDIVYEELRDYTLYRIVKSRGKVEVSCGILW